MVRRKTNRHRGPELCVRWILRELASISMGAFDVVLYTERLYSHEDDSDISVGPITFGRAPPRSRAPPLNTVFGYQKSKCATTSRHATFSKIHVHSTPSIGQISSHKPKKAQANSKTYACLSFIPMYSCRFVDCTHSLLPQNKPPRHHPRKLHDI